MENCYINIKEIAQAKGLKSTRSIRMEINKPESKYISREVKVNGGISYEILFSSLEPELQQKLRECETKSTAIVPLNYKPPVITDKARQTANHRMNIVKAALEHRNKYPSIKEADAEFLDLYNSGLYLPKAYEFLGRISIGTLRRYIQAYKKTGNAESLIPQYKIPDIIPDEFEVKELIPYRVDSNRNGTAHFFLDDYRFERCWKNADSQIEELKKYAGVLSPDFSMYTNYPEAFQIWQVYRNRWCAAYWQSKGIKVIPTISWSDESSYKYAFIGIPKNSVVAIGTVGVVNDKNAERLFMQGFKEMLKQLEPKRILIYGNRLTELEGYKNLQWFEPYTSKWNKKKGR